jgi:hypothetical protein
MPDFLSSTMTLINALSPPITNCSNAHEDLIACKQQTKSTNLPKH